jgi:hypothetical protein
VHHCIHGPEYNYDDDQLICCSAVAAGVVWYQKNKKDSDLAQLNSALDAVRSMPSAAALSTLRTRFPGVPVVPRGTSPQRTPNTLMYTMDSAGHIDSLGLNAAGVATANFNPGAHITDRK